MWVGNNLFTVQECQQAFAKTLSTSTGEGVQDVALAFVNWASDRAQIECDDECMASLGFITGADVEDLWAFNKSKAVQFRKNISESLAPNGGYRLFVLRGNLLEL